jgi:hypothetical protein
MTNKQIELCAKVYAAVLIYNAMGTGANSECFTDPSDIDKLSSELELMSYRMTMKLPGSLSVLGYASLDDVVNYAKENA